VEGESGYPHVGSRLFSLRILVLISRCVSARLGTFEALWRNRLAYAQHGLIGWLVWPIQVALNGLLQAIHQRYVVFFDKIPMPLDEQSGAPSLHCDVSLRKWGDFNPNPLYGPVAWRGSGFKARLVLARVPGVARAIVANRDLEFPIAIPTRVAQRFSNIT